MRTAAIIYARSNSTRYPQKCFAPLGKNSLPLIHWVLHRARLLDVDQIVFATSSNKTDDDLASSVERLSTSNLKIIRGSENNPIKRTIDCLNNIKIENFVRINGDSPFFPIDEINEALSLIKEKPHLKFISNLKPRRYPYGVAVEVINANFYINNSSHALSEELEHITSHLYRISSDQITTINNSTDQKEISLVIDTKEDHAKLNYLIQKRGLDYTSSWRFAI